MMMSMKRTVSMKTMPCLFFSSVFLLLLVVFSTTVYAVPASPFPIQVTQEDGTEITVQLFGDAFFNWAETLDGNVIAQDPDTGNWYYAEVSPEGEIVAGSRLVGSPNLMRGVYLTRDHIMPLARDADRTRGVAFDAPGVAGIQPLASGLYPITMNPAKNVQPMLVLLIEYNNRQFTESYAAAAGGINAFWSNRFFGNTGVTVNTYFAEMSGDFGLQFVPPAFLPSAQIGQTITTGLPAGVTSVRIEHGVARVRLNRNHPNISGFGGPVRDDINLAFSAVRSHINLNAFPQTWGTILNEDFNIYAILAGYEGSGGVGTPSVWGHASMGWWWDVGGYWRNISVNLNSDPLGAVLTYGVNGELIATGVPKGIGVIVHEIGHLLLLPDVYSNIESQGIIQYCVMASGSWGAVSGGRQGDMPTPLNPWFRYRLGWVTPTRISYDSFWDDYVTRNLNDVLKVYNPVDLAQFFMIENRQLLGFDAGRGIWNSHTGILIYHIDELVNVAAINHPTQSSLLVNDNRYHRTVDVEGFNGEWWWQNNPFFGNGGVFNAASTPNSNLHVRSANPPTVNASINNHPQTVASGISVRVTSANTANGMRVEVGTPPSFTINPTSITVTSTALVHNITAAGTATGNITISGWPTALPANVTAAITTSGNVATITITDSRPAGSPAITGHASVVTLTRGGINATLNVTLNLASIPMPTVTFNPTSAAITNGNLSQAIAVQGTATGNIAVSYTIPAALTGFVTVNWAAGTPTVTINGTRPTANVPPVTGNFNISVTRDGVTEAFNVTVDLTTTYTVAPTVTFNPTSAAITNGNLTQAIAVQGTATGNIAVSYTIPAALTGFVTVNWAAGTPTVTINGTRPTTNVPPVTGNFNISVTRDGVTEAFNVTVDLTTTYTVAPTVTFNPTSAAITNGNLSQAIAVQGTATGNIAVSYTIPAALTGFVTVNWAAGTPTVTINGTRPTANVPPVTGNFNISVTRDGVTEAFNVTVDLTTTYTVAPTVTFNPTSVAITNGNLTQAIAVQGTATGNIAVSYTIPAALTGFVTVNWAAGTPTVTINGTRPTTNVPPVTGNFNISVTREGVTEAFNVTVDLTTTYTVAPTVTFNPTSVAITNGNLSQAIAVQGTATGNIAVSYTIPAALTGFVTVNWAAGTPTVTINGTRPTTNVPPVTGNFNISVTRDGVTEAFNVTVDLTTTYTSLESHVISVLNGGVGANANPNPASAGQTVTLNAGTAPAGFVFDAWTTTSTVITIANPTSATNASFQMINGPVSVMANWAPIQPITRTISIANGGTGAFVTGGANHDVGTVVTINAGSRSGYNFSGWTFNTNVSFAAGNNALQGNTRIVMPNADVVATANWTQRTLTQFPETDREPSIPAPAPETDRGPSVPTPAPETEDYVPLWDPNAIILEQIEDAQEGDGTLESSGEAAILYLPEGVSEVHIYHNTIEQLIENHMSLQIVQYIVWAQLPLQVLEELWEIIADMESEFIISIRVQFDDDDDVTPNTNINFVDAEILFSIGDEVIHEFESNYMLFANLSGFEYQLLDRNIHRVTAIHENRNIGGNLNAGTNIFSINVNTTGNFIIAYVENLRRIVMYLDSPVISDRAGNAPTQYMDQLAIIQNGRTLIPVRFVAESLGADVEWTPATEYSPLTVFITLDDELLRFEIGEWLPGMDVPAQLIGRRTMVPLRFIGEFFGAVVSWDSETRGIEIVR